jgi:hypothetical protein
MALEAKLGREKSVVSMNFLIDCGQKRKTIDPAIFIARTERHSGTASEGSQSNHLIFRMF